MGVGWFPPKRCNYDLAPQMPAPAAVPFHRGALVFLSLFVETSLAPILPPTCTVYSFYF